MSKRASRLLLTLALGVVLTAPLYARDLSFEDRVRAQEAIERVYYSHQIGVTRSFEEAVPREVLEAKVRKYLEQSAALEKHWQTPVTAEMLERELQRISRGTRDPNRLLEMFEALERDPFLIRECLARATLVDRLSRNFYAFDTELHRKARVRARRIRDRIRTGQLEPSLEHPGRTVVTFIKREADEEGPTSTSIPEYPVDDARAPIEVSLDEFERVRAIDGRRIEEGRDEFLIRVVLSEGLSEIRVAHYVVPKRTWESWWHEVVSGLEVAHAVAVASEHGELPLPARPGAPGEWSSQDDAWIPGNITQSIDRRTSHSAVWTGSLMIVWGGYQGSYLNTGGRYDPATDTWTPTSVGANVPAPRLLHTAVWANQRMIVWGGDGGGNLNTGGVYDPVADTWTPTSVGANVPSPRQWHTAVSTGQHMIVWGGENGGTDLNTGGLYDPVTNSWLTTSIGANVPVPRSYHTAVWTGQEMIVWGGNGASDLNTGGLYDPATDSWMPTSTGPNVPAHRSRHTAVWTGQEMIVWGGYGTTGGIYDPVLDTWAPTSTGANVPEARQVHTAVWTGQKMIIWGGSTGLYENTGGLYDPLTDTWAPTSLGANVPSPRYAHTAVWTEQHMIVWGGQAVDYENTGGRYDPVTNSWTPTATASGGPSARFRASNVWTGNHFIVWGGIGRYSAWIQLGTGGRYDPVLDAWSPVTLVGAPSPRSNNASGWLDGRLIVWGGKDSSTYFDDGASYDPIEDAWSPISSVGAPTPRDVALTAIAAGNELIVWGGRNDTEYFGDGARYHSGTDTWTAMSEVGVPSPRWLAAVVWTEAQLLVWGGYDGTEYLGDGAIYSPPSNQWSPLPLPALEPRISSRGVWTGSEAIIWGGCRDCQYEGLPPVRYDNGARYDPAANEWMAMTTSGTPDGRSSHEVVWTDSEFIVWGGRTPSTSYSASGGRYNPVTDTWLPTTTTNVPVGRYGHMGVWTGSQVILWGGLTSTGFLDDGGLYDPGQSIDGDGDGYSTAEGDCDDTDADTFPGAAPNDDASWCMKDADGDDWGDDNPPGGVTPGTDCDDDRDAVYPGAFEVCDGVDNQCPGDIGHGDTDEIVCGPQRVIVVPGILGSVLKSYDGNLDLEVEWLDLDPTNINANLIDLQYSQFDAVTCPASGPLPGCIAATQIFECPLPLQCIDDGVPVDSYHELGEFLIAEGYEVLTFPYDWREDLTATGSRLHQTIMSDNLVRQRGDPVSFVSHSLGTLVVRRMLVDIAGSPAEPFSVLTDHSVYIAPPFDGSGFAVQPVITGQLDADGALVPSGGDALDALMVEETVVSSVRTWPSVYEALPRQGFFSQDYDDPRSCDDLLSSYPGLVWSDTDLIDGFDSDAIVEYGDFLSSLRAPVDATESVIASAGHATPHCALPIESSLGYGTEFLVNVECGDGTMTYETVSSLSSYGMDLHLVEASCPAGSEAITRKFDIAHGELPNNAAVHSAIGTILNDDPWSDVSMTIDNGCDDFLINVDGDLVVQQWDGSDPGATCAHELVWTASPFSLSFVDTEGNVSSGTKRDVPGVMWLGFPGNQVIVRPLGEVGTCLIHPDGDPGMTGHVFCSLSDQSGSSSVSAELTLDDNPAPWEVVSSGSGAPELHRDLDDDGTPDEIVPLEADEDVDGSPDSVDNCPTTHSADQADTDADLVGDACDNCSGQPNPDQANADGDVAGDVCDCAPSDGTAFEQPHEIANLRMVTKVDMVWDPDSVNSGSGTVYDVVRGVIGELPVGSGVSEICLVTGSTQSGVTDSATPPSTGYYYLIRGSNNCGTGTYGNATSGLERNSGACPP